MGWLTSLIPAGWRLEAAGVAIFAAIMGVAGLGIWLHAQWYAEGVASQQARIETLNRDLGTALAANATSEATIRALHADSRANDALISQYAARVAALTQQADDTAAAIRRLQQDDQTVDAYLRTPVPEPLRRVLDHAGAAAPGDANQHRDAAATR